jgi:hypothetical protein
LQAPLASVIRVQEIELQNAWQTGPQSEQPGSPAPQDFVVEPLVVAPLHEPQ